MAFSDSIDYSCCGDWPMADYGRDEVDRPPELRDSNALTELTRRAAQDEKPRMIHSRLQSTWLGPLLALASCAALLLLPAELRAQEGDEASYILAQLEDAAADDQPLAEQSLAAPNELPAPDDEAAKIELSDEAELLEQEEVIPLCTTGEVFEGRLWYTKFDFIYLFKQPLKNNFTIANDTADPEQTTDLLTDNLKLRWRPGMRVTIGRELGTDNLNRDQSIEFTYAGLFDWLESTTLNGVDGGDSVSNVFMSFFPDANSVEAEYQTELNSFELNFRLRPRLEEDRLIMAHDGTWTRQCSPGMTHSIFGGLRYIKYDESFVIRTSNTEPGTAYNAIQIVETQNDMFGIQFGGDLNHNDCRWYWGLRGKVGMLINAADKYRRDAVTFDGGFVGEFEQRGDDNQLALALDMGMFAAYQFHPRVSARIAYDATWLHGVAIAPDDIQEFGFGLTDEIDANENGIFHGLSLGVEMRW
jgi:hypothetical protein